jgi:hypothetical protein
MLHATHFPGIRPPSTKASSIQGGQVGRIAGKTPLMWISGGAHSGGKRGAVAGHFIRVL